MIPNSFYGNWKIVGKIEKGKYLFPFSLQTVRSAPSVPHFAASLVDEHLCFVVLDSFPS